ncbi:MAG: acetoin utilization protein AcuB, partial [Phascolarctobacterium sp.]|nr:acetoin utilization protein AcuB [Candidatus Phascolarctobacterium caballi]
NRLVGIISKKDIFRAFIEIMAMHKPCTRFTIETPDKVGVVAELATLFKEENINIMSLVPRVLPDGTATINIRADLGNQGLGIVGKITELGYKVIDVANYEGVK